MFSTKAAAIAASAMVALTLGLVLQNRYLVASSAPLTLFLVLARLMGSPPHLDIEVERSSDRQSIYEDETQTFTVRVRNNSPPLDFVEILDTLPENLRLETGSNHQFTSLQATQTFEFAYEVSPKLLGSYTIGPVKIRSADIFGLWVEERTYETFTNLRVFPQMQYVSRIDVRPRRTRHWPGEIISRKPGHGLEFYSLREYISGDPLKRINWRASARFDGLLSNQFMSELGGDTIIALDARYVSESANSANSLAAYSVRAAAIVAYRLLRDRNRVGMIVIGDRLEKVSPAFGRRQFNRILTVLSETRAGNTWEIGNLAGYLSIFFSRMTQIIFITPLLDEKSFRAIADISAKGYEVLAISPSLIAIEVSNAPDTRIYRIARDIVRLERQVEIDLLRKHAVVVDWRVNEPLSEALQEATFLWTKVKRR